MNVTLITVGKVKQDFKPLCDEYEKRFSKFGSIKHIIIREEPIEGTISDAQRTQLQNREWSKMEHHCQGYVVALDEQGKHYDSTTLSELLFVHPQVTFIIGGAYGLSDTCKKHAHLVLAFSKLTFPHDMAKLILLEQLYRAGTISIGHPYHKQ